MPMEVSIAEVGNALYANGIQPAVEPGENGKVIAIDVVSGDYALGDSSIIAARSLRSQHPAATVWLMRVGRGYLRRMGGRQPS